MEITSGQSHKGQACPYKPITCQEGYCDQCWIYWERNAGEKREDGVVTTVMGQRHYSTLFQRTRR